VTRGFRRVRGEVRIRLADGERRVLHDLFTEVHDLLEDPTSPKDEDPLAELVGIGTAVRPPDDPALARLLPDAHKDDPQAAAEFRRYTEAGLRARKRQGLKLARRTLDRGALLRLDDAEAGAWLVALTDVRLVLAERIGLRTDDDHAILEQVVAQLAEAGPAAGSGRPGGSGSPEDDSDDLDGDDGDGGAAAGERLAMTLALYDFLAWLQETLVTAMAATLPHGTDDPRSR
jgi:Domain of unknown function (DUF2017)